MGPYTSTVTISLDGRLELSQLPFKKGELVEVTVKAVENKENDKDRYPLRGSVTYSPDYDPFAPACPEEDWEALK